MRLCVGLLFTVFDLYSRYLILDMLGKGSYGQVVKCRDLETQETVSVKIIKNKPVSFGQSMMEVAVLELVSVSRVLFLYFSLTPLSAQQTI